jgi:hypothetical protein
MAETVGPLLPRVLVFMLLRPFACLVFPGESMGVVFADVKQLSAVKSQPPGVAVAGA